MELQPLCNRVCGVTGDLDYLLEDVIGEACKEGNALREMGSGKYMRSGVMHAMSCISYI